MNNLVTRYFVGYKDYNHKTYDIKSNYSGIMYIVCLCECPTVSNQTYQETPHNTTEHHISVTNTNTLLSNEIHISTLIKTHMHYCSQTSKKNPGHWEIFDDLIEMLFFFRHNSFGEKRYL